MELLFLKVLRKKFQNGGNSGRGAHSGPDCSRYRRHLLDVLLLKTQRILLQTIHFFWGFKKEVSSVFCLATSLQVLHFLPVLSFSFCFHDSFLNSLENKSTAFFPVSLH